MSELGIFIDESGFFETNHIQDKGMKDLYIVSFLFHNKSISINEDVEKFENFLEEIGLSSKTSVHTMPLIRGKSPYSILNGTLRRKVFQNLFQFMRKLKLKHRTFVCDKKYCSSKQAIKKNLENYINTMVSDNYDFFNKFDEIVIYYDEGQDYLTKILHNIFSRNLNNVRFKENVSQVEYRLLQCADLVCSLELINQRKQNGEYIKAIENFFISNRNYNQNYRKAFKNLEL